MAGSGRLLWLCIAFTLGWLPAAADNLGPLTTTFTPPTTCFLTTAFPATGGAFDVTGAGLAFAETYLSIISNSATSCYPSNYGYLGSSTNYFSPGLICPKGYSTGGLISTMDQETFAFCCPSGFRQPGETDFISCYKTIEGILTASAVLTRSGTGLEFYVGSMSTEFSSTEHTLKASVIPLRWRAVDVPSSSTTTTPDTSSFTSSSSISTTSITNREGSVTSTASQSTTSQSAPSSSPENSTSRGGGLSGSDKIALGVGIGVGVGIGLPGAVVASIKLWRAYFRNSRVHRQFRLEEMGNKIAI